MSDPSGQFPASCFDEAAGTLLSLTAEASGCVLMQVELDWRDGEDVPRVAVRQAESLERLAESSPVRTELTITSADGIPALAVLLAGAPRGRGEVVAILPECAAARECGVVRLRLAAGVAISEELTQRAARLPGIVNVDLAIIAPGNEPT
ncbi:MAG: hypothetical protein MUF41_02630 [Sphingopyxis sp.]|nr:hypothetical protein [Sphingopyxis sp.]